MVSTRKKRQWSRRRLSQLDDFDQDNIVGNVVSDRHENVVVNEGTGDRELTVKNSGNKLTANENLVKVKTLERCFNGRIDREKGNIVHTIEDRIQNAILTAIDSINTPKIELAIRSINASSGRDAISVIVNSKCGEHIMVYAPFENVSERNK